MLALGCRQQNTNQMSLKGDQTGLSTSKITHHIYFVRHGETESNAKTSESADNFSPKGSEQVRALTDKLQGMDVKFDQIYISPLWRTRSTIKPYLDGQGNRYSAIDNYIESGIAECCWDQGSMTKDVVEQSAAKIRTFLMNQTTPSNVLIVGHYHSGKILLDNLVGKTVDPQNADLMVFDFDSSPPNLDKTHPAPQASDCRAFNRDGRTCADVGYTEGQSGYPWGAAAGLFRCRQNCLELAPPPDCHTVNRDGRTCKDVRYKEGQSGYPWGRRNGRFRCESGCLILVN